MFETLSFRRALALAIVLAVLLLTLAVCLRPEAMPFTVVVFLTIVTLGFHLPMGWRSLRPAARRRLARGVLAIALGGAVGASLSGCATADITKLIKASEANPACYMDTRVSMTPMMLFGFVIPVFSGTFAKVCHADKAPGASAAPLAPGQLLAPVGAPPAVPPSAPAPT